jgi:hypothetical protein
MKISTQLLISLTALMVAACGGGGSSSSPGSAGSDTAGGTSGSTKTTPGVWQGTLTSPTTGDSTLVGLTNATGQSVWMTTDGRVWSGQMPMSGTQFNATMAGYMYPGSRFPDGSTHSPSSMMFSYGNGAWTGQYTGGGDSGTFNVTMSAMWDRPATLATLAGTYTRTTSIGYTMTMSIATDGVFTASDTRGCVINGTVTVPDATHNLYQLDATVTSCGVLNGAYQGHGTLVDATAMRSWMTVMGCFQYGANGWTGGSMMGGGMMGGGTGNWWPNTGTNTVPDGTGNLFMFAMTNGQYAIMDALAK